MRVMNKNLHALSIDMLYSIIDEILIHIAVAACN